MNDFSVTDAASRITKSNWEGRSNFVTEFEGRDDFIEDADLDCSSSPMFAKTVKIKDAEKRQSAVSPTNRKSNVFIDVAMPEAKMSTREKNTKKETFFSINAGNESP